MRASRLASADSQFQAALARCAHFTGALVGAGYVATRRADDRAAESYFERALIEQPANYDALTGLGMLAYRHGDLSASRRRFTAALRVVRHLKGTQQNNFGLITSDTVLGIYHQATTGIFAVLVGVVALSLVVGGIVIMNIMLMVVSERSREIGLRKALGARQSDIMLQVLIEAVLMAASGGALGVALGAVLTQVFAKVFEINLHITGSYIMLALAVSSIVGIASGWYPASRASKLDPVEALRSE